MKQKANRNLGKRLWAYQSERVPLVPVVVMSALTAGVIYSFAETPFRNYLASVVIIVLYLIQIRVSDEKKDFLHDNKFYKNRPVQRGLVTLDELAMVGRTAIILQLIIYASFLDWRIFILGVVSQTYAFFTRKEFYIRSRLRKHLLTYNLLHQVQLIILFFAIMNIIEPNDIGYLELLIFTFVNIATVELARKTLPANEDSAKDSYSARLGYKGVAIALTTFAILAATMSTILISRNANYSIFIIVPVAALIPIINYCYHYAVNPNNSNQKGIENSAIAIFVACMLSVILGT